MDEQTVGRSRNRRWLGRSMATGAVALATSMAGLAAHASAYAHPGAAARAALESRGAEIKTAQVSHPGPVPYGGGKVMHSLVAYDIYYQPAGTHFEPSPSNTATADGTYEADMNQFFPDLNGSSYYNILTQYTDTSGPPSNNVSFGGSVIVTTPPAGNTNQLVLSDADEEKLIADAIAANGWTNTPYVSEFFLFTAQGVSDASGPGCGYHSAFNDSNSNNQELVWSFMPANDGINGSCGVTNPPANTPHNDQYIDVELTTLAHEVAESVSDPDGNAWNDTTVKDSQGNQQGEIADLCDQTYGTFNSDGSNVSLNGHPYMLQYLFSNADVPAATASGQNACVKSLTTTPTVAHVSALRVVVLARGAVVRWHVASTNGIAGFQVYSATHALTGLIAPHRGGNYVARIGARGAGHLTLHVLFRDGQQEIIPAS